MPPQIKSDGSPVKIAWVGDLIVPTGFGRIGNEVCKRLVMRGWQVVGASLPWTGHPWQDGRNFPYPIFPLGGKDVWPYLAGWLAQENPDVIVSCQDFPYADTIYHNLRIDWSNKKFFIITPIDGVPIHPAWLSLVDEADGTFVISEFGVEAMRLAGRQAGLLHPAADKNEFYPAEDAVEVKALRERIGIAPDAFVLGSFMMNQGRKAVPDVLAMFFEFARDKKEAMLYMDMDKMSPAGWDIPSVLVQMGLSPEDRARVKFREDAFAAGMLGLRERYLLCDVTCQFAHREGFGLPNLESQACKIPPMVIDWCSGSEIATGGRGVLVRRIDYMTQGTWGGAKDAFPDMHDALNKLNAIYRDTDLRLSIAQKGYRWARRFTWDKATDAFEEKLKKVLEAQRKERKSDDASAHIYQPGVGSSDAGDTRNAGKAIAPAPAESLDNHPILQSSPGLTVVSEGVGADGGDHKDGNTGAGRRHARPRSKQATEPAHQDGAQLE